MNRLQHTFLKTRQGAKAHCPKCGCAVGLKYLYRYSFGEAQELMCESCGMARIRALNYADKHSDDRVEVSNGQT
jgi:hypothetical protein